MIVVNATRAAAFGVGFAYGSVPMHAYAPLASSKAAASGPSLLSTAEAFAPVAAKYLTDKSAASVQAKASGDVQKYQLKLQQQAAKQQRKLDAEKQSWVPWVIGGVAAVGITGLIVYAARRRRGR